MPSKVRHRPLHDAAHRTCWFLSLLSVALGMAGYLAPWVGHEAAGLNVTGLDLAEYVKFLPEVISGQVKIQRELFYLPPLAASLVLSLLASRRTLPILERYLLALAAIPPALAMLPPAWTPELLRQGEFRLQVLAIGLCLLAVPGIAFTRRLPDRLVLLLLVLLAMPAGIWPTWGFLHIQPAISSLYRHSLTPAWGFWASSAAFLLLAVLSLLELLKRGQRPQAAR